MAEIKSFKRNNVKDFEKMKSKCIQTSKISFDFIDEFLVPYTIDRESIEITFA